MLRGPDDEPGRLDERGEVLTQRRDHARHARFGVEVSKPANFVVLDADSVFNAVSRCDVLRRARRHAIHRTTSVTALNCWVVLEREVV